MRIMIVVAALVLTAALACPAQTDDSTRPAKSAVSAKLQVCTNVVDRAPTGAGDMFSADVGELCLWTHVTGTEPETSIKHVWYFQGREVASVELPVRAASWRTWSRKSVTPDLVGDWEVKVLDASGAVIGSATFKTAKAVEPAQP